MTTTPDTTARRDPGYPFGQRDAMKWADEFDRIFPDTRPDTGTMLGWFANAIMTGYDIGSAQAAEKALADAAERIANARRMVLDDVGAALSQALVQGNPFEPYDRIYVAKVITRVLDEARQRVDVASGTRP